MLNQQMGMIHGAISNLEMGLVTDSDRLAEFSNVDTHSIVSHS